jgi:hypothetical protein
MRAFAILAAAAAALLLLALGLHSCRDSQDVGKAGPGACVLLEIDGIRVTRDDLAAWYPYFEAIDPTLGHRLRDCEILDQIVLPTKFAEHWFAADRARLRQLGEALIAAAPTLDKLVEASKSLEDEQQRGRWTDPPAARTEVPFVVARAMFDEKRLGQVQGPIATPWGYSIVATRRIVKGMTSYQDHAEAFVVRLETHAPNAFAVWWSKTKSGAKSRVTLVHEDLRDSLPVWMHP